MFNQQGISNQFTKTRRPSQNTQTKRSQLELSKRRENFFFLEVDFALNARAVEI